MGNDAEREFLDTLIGLRQKCLIYTLGGYQMRGIILKQDDKVIVVKGIGESKSKIVYKNGISTIEPL